MLLKEVVDIKINEFNAGEREREREKKRKKRKKEGDLERMMGREWHED